MSWLDQVVRTRCVLTLPRLLEQVRQDHAQHHPGLDETEIRCPFHREYHPLRLNDLHLQSPQPEISNHQQVWRSNLPAIPVNAGANYCRWHRTSSPALIGHCVYCGDELHVHQDALGSVKSGRAGQGYLVEKCPHGHHENAVMPVYGRKAIRIARLEQGAPVLQMTLSGVK